MDFIAAEKYVAAHRTEIIDSLCRFFVTDTLLFWSDKADLAAYQKAHWQPLLDMLNTVFKIELKPTTTILAPENNSALLQYKKQLETTSDKELAVCHMAAAETKSVLLGLLLAKQQIDAKKAYEAAFLEEIYQNKFWGEDVAALNARQKSLELLENLERYLQE